MLKNFRANVLNVVASNTQWARVPMKLSHHSCFLHIIAVYYLRLLLHAHIENMAVLPCYYTLNSPTLLWLAESVQWIFQNVCDVIIANYTIIMSRSPVIMSCMTSKFLRSIYNKTISRFGFWDIKNNQGLGTGCQPQLWLITLTSTLIILDIAKTSSNNCLYWALSIAKWLQLTTSMSFTWEMTNLISNVK